MSEFHTALVTGASRGIGAAIVRRLRERGMEVHAAALADDDLDRIAGETGAIAHGIDLRDPAAVAAELGSIPVDLLVNNAGVLPKLAPFQATPASDIDVLLDVNVRAALHTTHLFLAGMIERRLGHIVFMGSIAGRHPTPNSAVYAGTKGAIHAFAEGLRCDLLGTGVRVTVLMPGRVETQLYDQAFGSREAAAGALYSQIDAIRPDDIATAICAAIDMPPNVDITALEIVPTDQIFGGSSVAATPSTRRA